jgi:hypothetical protein
MKKSFWSYLVVVLALFISCYWLGKKSRPVITAQVESAEPQKEVTPTASAPVQADSSKSVVSSTQVTKALPVPTSLGWQNLKGGDLFNALFDQKAFVALNSQDLAQMRARFFQPYPASEPLYKAALLDRLGILKALEQQVPLRRGPSSVIAPELQKFYSQVLANPNENWLVKRQTFRNLHTVLSEKEKEAYYHSLDSRIVSQAVVSEAELVEGALNETR